MIADGNYYVVTLGRRYLRYSDCLIVTHQLEYAEKHSTCAKARKCVKRLKRDPDITTKTKSKFGIQFITIVTIKAL